MKSNNSKLVRRLTAMSLIEILALLVIPNVAATFVIANGNTYNPNSAFIFVPHEVKASIDENFSLLSKIGYDGASYFSFLRIFIYYLSVPFLLLNIVCSIIFGFGYGSARTVFKSVSGQTYGMLIFLLVSLSAGIFWVYLSGDTLGVSGVKASMGNIRDGSWWFVLPLSGALCVLCVPMIIGIVKFIATSSAGDN